MKYSDKTIRISTLSYKLAKILKNKEIERAKRDNKDKLVYLLSMGPGQYISSLVLRFAKQEGISFNGREMVE